MKKEKPFTIARKDIHKIIKAMKLLDVSKKQDILDKITDIKAKQDD